MLLKRRITQRDPSSNRWREGLRVGVIEQLYKRQKDDNYVWALTSSLASSLA